MISKHQILQINKQTLPGRGHPTHFLHFLLPFKHCPFPRCGWAQKVPGEFSSPYSEIRETNVSPSKQILSPSPPGHCAAQWCQSRGFEETLTAVPWHWLSSLLSVVCCLLAREKTQIHAQLELNSPSSSLMYSKRGGTTVSSKEMEVATHKQETTKSFHLKSMKRSADTTGKGRMAPTGRVKFQFCLPG